MLLVGADTRVQQATEVCRWMETQKAGYAAVVLCGVFTLLTSRSPVLEAPSTLGNGWKWQCGIKKE